MNIIIELGTFLEHRHVYSDNEAMINFVNGEGQGRGMKHATLRLWYMRQQVDRGYTLEWLSGKVILANPMTKAVDRKEQFLHKQEVLGQLLLPIVEEMQEGEDGEDEEKA